MTIILPHMDNLRMLKRQEVMSAAPSHLSKTTYDEWTELKARTTVLKHAAQGFDYHTGPDASMESALTQAPHGDENALAFLRGVLRKTGGAFDAHGASRIGFAIESYPDLKKRDDPLLSGPPLSKDDQYVISWNDSVKSYQKRKELRERIQECVETLTYGSKAATLCGSELEDPPASSYPTGSHAGSVPVTDGDSLRDLTRLNTPTAAELDQTPVASQHAPAEHGEVPVMEATMARRWTDPNVF